MDDDTAALTSGPPAPQAADVLPNRERSTRHAPRAAASLCAYTATTSSSADGRRCVTLSGEIDMDNAAAVRRVLATTLGESRTGLDVDLAAVGFCNSSGLHVLLDLRRHAANTGKSLVLTGLSPAVARLLEITETAPLFAGPARPGSGPGHGAASSGTPPKPEPDLP
ncbi:STAS domain-containing protein [Streptomyces sp. SP17BM10]|uniref:STAS domain-containing protein n=1 Tax=Streptomyces sp. SP17BM10 TaxID=3002530 RepID=UPI002E765419|nr:STAS domain-containing protein [Streptomyces sp. SP17BM10]MEE1782178.1 STAS domain-containing protein [Streptomyces sp. SP17BM10]